MIRANASKGHLAVKNKPKITEIMTVNPVYVHTSQPVSDAYDLVKSGAFHHIPVLDGRVPVGMISATDILKLAYDTDGTDDRLLRTMLDHQFNLADAMTEDVVTVAESADIREVIAPMASGAMHSVVIVDDSGELVGIVTSTDLIQLLDGLI